MPMKPGLMAIARFLALRAPSRRCRGARCSSAKPSGWSPARWPRAGTSSRRDDDPELVGQAIPFGLKLYESLLDSSPKNKELLIATCSNFTEYGVAYLETEALVLGEAEHHDQVAHLNSRALKLYLRAKGYCLRAMEVRFPGITQKLLKDPVAALKAARRKTCRCSTGRRRRGDPPSALGIDKPELVIDLPTVRALAERAIALDETWAKGTLHEMFISLDSQPEALGGSVEHARAHFARAVELQKGTSPGPYVSLAVGVAQPAQDRAEFESLLKQALAIDPERIRPPGSLRSCSSVVLRRCWITSIRSSPSD